MTIIENITARKALTASLAAFFGVPDTNPSPDAPKTASEAAAALFGWVYKEPGQPQLEDCKVILRRVSDERGQDEAEAVLARFGGVPVAKLSPLTWAMFHEYCSYLLVYGVSAHGSVNVHDVPADEKRDRWLLWHPESSCLWEVRGKLSGELDDEQVEDVSGLPEYEKRFVEQSAAQKEDEL